jgi:hypothetical protein
MADYNFVLNKIFKLVLHRVSISWPRLSALDLSVWYHPPRASLPRLPQAGCIVGNQENNGVNLMLKQNVNLPSRTCWEGLSFVHALLNNVWRKTT